MAHLSKDESVAVINIKLTAKGRELLTKGIKDEDLFDLVKYSFGDSEIDYRLINGTDDSKITGLLIQEPSFEGADLKSKLYQSGEPPSGTALVSLTVNEITMTKNQSGINVGASTSWLPIEIFDEEYVWTNLGPLNDYDFNIVKNTDTKGASFVTYDVVGSTTIKVEGKTSSTYALLTLNIE